ncbi:hypothetical protein O3G_MSEX013344 [Manduca sexta]|uniref:Ty3 transposon capsid-like protein domain-containing protein n=1 Tax=Manduca sexta TaxID=7130 RepID=A0A921ZRZ4_MANSE|nr:hypothetical protein O3G_MSEX013344 [Manduca sexta]
MPRRRKSLSTDDSVQEESEKSVTMSQEALTTLLTTLQQSQAEFCSQILREVRSSTPQTTSIDPNSTSCTSTITKNNFSKCASRFGGSPEESVDNFIDAIQVYKTCLNICDENALLGMSMLLHSSAGTWWQGVKGTTRTWEDAITKLRSAYGERRPPFRIYVELFSLVQDKENTDRFISKVRALLAKLPQGDLSERVELDMTFGLLDRRIRKRIDRESISTFDELLKKARAIEDSLSEVRHDGSKVSTSSSCEERAAAPVEPARAAARAEPARAAAIESSRAAAAPSSFTKVTDFTTKAGKPKFCVYCKRTGHSKDTCEKLKNNAISEDTKNVKCYGCGAANVIRSKCTKCNNAVNSEHSAFCSVLCESQVPQCIESLHARSVRSDRRCATGSPLLPQPQPPPTPLPQPLSSPLLPQPLSSPLPSRPPLSSQPPPQISTPKN